jgi:hypothetical protein
LHSHGQSVLGLISGFKHWLLYPPGHSPPADLQKHWNPFLPVLDWLEILQEFLSVEVMEYNISSNISKNKIVPLLCIQKPGEIVYIPAGWSHLTLNIIPPEEDICEINENKLLIPTVPSTDIGINNKNESSAVVIGIGMQSIWLAEDRELFCRQILKTYPHNYDALKGLAISIFHKAYILENNTYSFDALDEALHEAISSLR